jgi:hypothetical protein
MLTRSRGRAPPAIASTGQLRVCSAVANVGKSWCNRVGASNDSWGRPMFRSQYGRNYRLSRRPCDEIATPPACSRTGQLNEQASKIIVLLAVNPARHHKGLVLLTTSSASEFFDLAQIVRRPTDRDLFCNLARPALRFPPGPRRDSSKIEQINSGKGDDDSGKPEPQHITNILPGHALPSFHFG